MSRNKGNTKLRAAWRKLTDEQIKKLPATCKDAYTTGSLYYLTGKPCKHGHIAPKARNNQYCLVCREIKEKEKRTKKIPVIKKEVKITKTIIIMGIKFNKLLSENKE